MTEPGGAGAPAPHVDLYWIPLGAGDTSGCVRWNGRLFEVALAIREHRRPLDLTTPRWSCTSAGPGTSSR